MQFKQHFLKYKVKKNRTDILSQNTWYGPISTTKNQQNLNSHHKKQKNKKKGRSCVTMQTKIHTCVRYLNASTTGVIISLYASICTSEFYDITLSLIKIQRSKRITRYPNWTIPDELLFEVQSLDWHGPVLQPSDPVALDFPLQAFSKFSWCPTVKQCSTTNDSCKAPTFGRQKMNSME